MSSKSQTLNVEQARNAYLEDNGFTLEGYDARFTPASIFGVPLLVPNTKKHRWAIKLHDLHHVATGYGTDPIGEGEISAWELRRGLKGLGPYVGAIVISIALLGIFIAPRRTFAAWRASGETRGSLFQTKRSYDDLLKMTVGELRDELNVPSEGLARSTQRRRLIAL